MSHAEHRGFRHPFLLGTHFLGGVGDNPRTITELAMSQCSVHVRSKPEWWKLFRQDCIRREWKTEALQTHWTIRTPSGYVDTNLSDLQVEYVINELSGYAALVDEKHRCQVSCFERIWESDCLLDTLDLDALNTELSRISDHTRPATNDLMTAYLIDPYSCNLIYGRTLVLDIRHSALNVELPPSHLGNYFTAQKSVFLPTDFSVSSTGSVKALSYINNLHPRKVKAYLAIEKLLGACIPLFGHVLTDLHRNNPLPQRIKGACRYTEWDEPEPPEHSDDEEGWSSYEHELRRWVMHRPLTLPDVPPNGYPGGLQQRKHTVNLNGRKLQVVVNVFENRLQPNGPDCAETPWHVEGMKNERIVACALHCSSMENVTANSIEFRMAVTSPRGFHAGDTGATVRTWAMKDGDPCHQYIGSRHIRTGLTICFPNIYQYRHTPLQLLDPSREGYQRVVAFYLVDPEIQPVISTTKVPPQQKQWIKSAVERHIDSRLPIELVESIIEEVDGLLTEEDASMFRQEMMEEREHFWSQNDNYHFCIPFDIWNELAFDHN